MKLAYRPEIDGLRTIAVLLVILHHLGWKTFSGGYIGVDIFFVISGYLITSIIYAEIKEHTFSIANFYKRRIVRLAPAYFLVLIVTSLLALIYMLPVELLKFAQSAVYSTFFLANFYMWKEVGGYFGSSSDVVPLLHLWSLAVEEQFYMFWPMIMLSVYSVFGRRFILPLISLAVIVGAIVSEWGVRHYLAASYYLLPTRFFEMMIGALIAIIPYRKVRSITGTEIPGFMGLGLIAWSAITFTPQRFFPGYSALVPCIGAALIIAFTVGGRGFIGRFLSLPSLVYLGKISYPAYLWHWPIIAFINLQQVEIDFQIGLLVLVATLVLSVLTHKYVEHYFQSISSCHNINRVASWGFVIPCLFILGFSFAINNLNGLPSRFSPELNQKSTAFQSYSNKIRGRCNEGAVNNPLSEDDCILGVSTRPVDFLLVGDSHANHFTGMLNIMAKDAGVRGYDITQSATVYLPDVKRFYYQDGVLTEYKNFELRNNVISSIIKNKKYRAVIVAGYFNNYIDTGEFSLDDGSIQSFETSFVRALEKIINSGSKVFIIDDTPTLNSVKENCTINNIRFNRNDSCVSLLAEHLERSSRWYQFLNELKNKYPEISILEPNRIICDQIHCQTELDGIPLYRDAGHLNYMGSELIGKIYISKFGNPLLMLHDQPHHTVHDSLPQ